MTTDGCDLLATTGSEYLFRLRPDAAGILQLVSKTRVTINGKPVHMLNELEFVTPKIWVNQWLTSWIFRVDPLTGVVEKKLDIRSLFRWTGEQTPNGVAYSTFLGRNTLLVTGKLWPQMFALQLSTSDLCGGEAPASSWAGCPSAPPSACWQGQAQAQAKQAVATSAPADFEAQATQAVATSAAVADHGGQAPQQEAEVAATVATVVPSAEGMATVVQSAEGMAAIPRPPTSREFVAPAPLPLLCTLMASASAAVLAVVAVWVPLFLFRYRRQYKTEKIRADMASSI